MALPGLGGVACRMLMSPFDGLSDHEFENHHRKIGENLSLNMFVHTCLN